MKNSNGFYIINKPQNITSFGVIAKLRKQLGIKKIGHCGTLDPQAEGVLVIAINKATKIIEYLVNDTKKYVVTLELGKTSDTFDIWGKVKNTESAITVSDELVQQVIAEFNNLSYDQIPPIFSAIKVAGKRLYEYARAEQTVEIKSRPVTIKSITKVTKESHLSWSFECFVSKGTYIRSLVHDIGQKLQIGAVMSRLVRIQSGKFKLIDALEISEVNENNLLPIQKVWPYDIINNINSSILQRLQNGLKCHLNFVDGVSLVVHKDKPFAILITKNGETKVHKGMWSNDESI